jgi:MerR family copper efflux transcriptional regulator
MSELVASAKDERVTARFVRFLIAEGVMAPPRGGRANAEYGDDHLAAIRRYLQLRDLGLTASRTKEVVAGAAVGPVPIFIAPGLTLLVNQEKVVEPPSRQEIARRIAGAVDLIKPKEG